MSWLFHLCPANLILAILTVWLIYFVAQVLAQEYRWHRGLVRSGHAQYISRWAHFVVSLSRSMGHGITQVAKPFWEFSVEYENQHCQCPRCIERSHPNG